MRKGLEISTNFAVILIITILIMGLGIAFLRNVFSSTTEIQNSLERQTDKEIEQLLVEEGSLVAIPYTSASLRSGEKRLFAIGVRNVLPQQQRFQFTVQYDTAVINNEMSPGNVQQMQQQWLQGLDRQVIEAKTNSFASSKIYLRAPSAPKGTYYFNVCVTTVDQDTPDESYSCALQSDESFPAGLYSDKMYQIQVDLS